MRFSYVYCDISIFISANLEPPPYSVESPSQPPTVLQNSNQTTQPAPPPYSAYPVYSELILLLLLLFDNFSPIKESHPTD